MRNEWIEKKIFLIIKTYPNSSKKYRETVCIAGITEDGEWIRLYPINFRELEEEKKFKKYTWVSTNIKAAKETLDGKRVDSYKPDMDVWKLLRHVGTEKGWSERKSIIYPTKHTSIEELANRFAIEKKSLGIFKPKKVLNLEIVRNDKSSRANHEKFTQLDLFTDVPQALEDVPYEFRYSFQCDDVDCKGHKMIILDWEIYEAYRIWRKKYTEEKALAAIKNKWMNELCGPDKDTHFIVGTHNRFNTFMIIGVFWPPNTPYMDTLF